ncbi:hypothetical protein D8674_001412 [Pyrus ussuriensis x Pyrus communis]|uniref:PLAT domain-containing protein n=1 Tax=Pyrus ussuriensis x Pyrus communis TaxID=2448454 RepID=A0A5N5FB79_9ROSA|nr:hypothetical protein D8674_001412 [Pyrus ussuriensis x Pyrus communis]
MTSFRFTETLMAIALFLSTAAGNPYDKCVYTIYVKTGSIIKAGTDSKISMTLGDFSGRSVWVPDLRSWGLMGPHYDYFERGKPGLCRLTLTSNGFGAHAGWYCDHVEVTATAPNTACWKSIFYVQQWLSNDVAPYQMTATRDACNPWNVNAGADQRGKDGKFVVEYPKRYA